ncbi:MAG: hypothetical protein PHN31_01680 [Candidatus Gracilibacteria bacterium]|nr:hypothetical protein [Candidatus Gracilibacteria bacterium]
MEATAQKFEGIGCSSIEELEIASGGSSYLKLKDGDKVKMRFLQGPFMAYVSQEFDDVKKEYIGDKIRYDFNDPEAKKDQHAKLTLTYLIYNYVEKKVQLWEISQSTIQKNLKALNEMKPDLSAFDIQVTRENNKSYQIISGNDKPFDLKEVIAEVMEKGLMDRINKSDEHEEAAPGFDDEEAAIAEQIEAKKPVAKMTKADVEEEFK